MTVNLVTSANPLVTVSTCLVGLVLLLPRTDLRATVRYTLSYLRPGAPSSDVTPSEAECSIDHEAGERDQTVREDPAMSSGDRELVDA